MNSIQKYVLNSLFVRNQITEEKLAQALDTFSNESAIDAFLSVLITGEETKKKDLFSTGLKETKDLVDMYTEELDKETMENIERQFKCNGFEIEIKQEYYISFINYYM